MAYISELTVTRTTSWAPVTDVDPANLEDVAGELNALLADVFAFT
jgi:hypothetical protein